MAVREITVLLREPAFGWRIDERGVQAMLDVLRLVEPGQCVTFRFYYGTQEEDWDGSGYDDDSCSVTLNDGETTVSVVKSSILRACEEMLRRLKAKEGQ